MLGNVFAASADTTITLAGLLLSLAAALLLGLFAGFVYLKTQKDGVPSQSFAITLVMLPAVVTVIILLVGSNIARAFSLSGAFAIIRFRSAPGNPKDITYVLFSMAVGLACGMGYLVYAVIVAVALCAVMALLELAGFGAVKAREKTLKIMIPEDLDYENAFDGVLQKYTLSHTLKKVKTADLGSLFELVYHVVTKENVKDKDFIDDLRCRNGNLNISLVMDVQNSEF
ncbi:DUF4956 domain-containing protein [Clostridia bacterium]|nr:DUF4956 domain-containing protein [Clostridia bacterium]